MRVRINHLSVSVLNSGPGLGRIGEGQLLQLGGHGAGARAAAAAVLEMAVVGADRPAAAAAEVIRCITVVTWKALEKILK